MGTTSLVISIMLMMFGFGVAVITLFQEWAPTMLDTMRGNLIFGITIIVVGAFFLRKYDNDKKKENLPKSKTKLDGYYEV